MKSGAMTRRRAAMLVVLALTGGAAVVSGCSAAEEPKSKQTTANMTACGAEGCHQEYVDAQAGASHSALPCGVCHEGTGAAHAKDPKTAIAITDWTIGSCSECHEGEALTYLYDDNAQVGPFGGSQREPAQPKVDTFPKYKTIVAGHAFAKDYNEEGAHKYMLEDHYATTRGKFETCVQCKSSKIAYAWKEGKPVRVNKTEEIVLTHTATQGVPPKKVTIPKGTVITYKTDPVSRTVDAKAIFPDGTTYTSKPAASEDATKNFNMLWASTIASIKDTWPYGAGCNHCHDPHTGKDRLLRQAMLQSIEGSGGVDGQGGVNPYQSGSPTDTSKATARDRQVLACAQCHVEYTCGKSGVDKIDRDAFGWAKAIDLDELYSNKFNYTQDWKHAIIGEPLIKSQHSEAELYWNSTHYNAGASCSACHMPEVRRGGQVFRSHWLTSPYKYGDKTRYAAFSAATGLDAGYGRRPCETCHSDRTALGITQQKAFFASQAEVEKLLATSVNNLGALKAAGKNKTPGFALALGAHRKAHVIWENLAVSENSMGFHNYGEAMTSMAEAKLQVGIALAAEQKTLK